MSPSEKILMYNFIAYLLVALFFLYKDHFKFGVKNAGFFWLAFSALSSYLFYCQPGFKRTIHYSIMTPEPFVYLFPCLVALFLPIRKINASAISWEMELLPRKKIMIIAKVLTPFLLFLFVAYTYQTMHTSLVNMGDIRQDLYDGSLKNPFFNMWIGNTISRLFTQTKVLLYCLSFYCFVCFREKNIYIWILIVLPYVIGFEHAYSTATRSSIFFIMMIVLFQYFLYNNLFDAKIRRKIRMIIIICLGTFTALLIAMSVSRFSDNATLFYYKYAGEAMINFNGLLFNRIHGTTDGVAYFWYIPQKLGFMQVNFSDLFTKWSFIESKTGVSGQFFYTMIGSLILEFGKVVTYFVVLLIVFFERFVFSKKMTAIMLVFLSWVVYHLINAVFYLPIQGDAGVLSCLWMILFYNWMKPKKKVG